MDYKTEFIQRAIDANALTSVSAAGTAINPNNWDFKLRDYEEANLVMVQLCEPFDFRGPGSDYKVTIDVAPTAAVALTETSDISVSTSSTRNITFTPTEYGKACQVSQKEINRSFFNTMDRYSKMLGYSLALGKDTAAITAARGVSTTVIMPNSKSAATALASTDTIGYTEVIKAAQAIEGSLYTPSVLVVNHIQKAQLLALDKVNKANEFGSRDAIAKGLVGELFGINIYVTTQITNEASGATNTAKALMLGKSKSGEAAIGYAVKMDPIIRMDYDVLGRFHTMAAFEEYNFQVLHPNAVVPIQTWSA